MLKLHLGCGKRDFGKDWVHMDKGVYPHVIQQDISNLHHIRDNTVDLIYSAHAFGYFDRKKGLCVLQEWHRVLKLGGLLRLAVPDFEAMMQLYLSKKYPLEFFLGPLYGKWFVGDDVIYEKTIYDFVSLKEALKVVGFKDVRRYDWRKTEHAHIDDHSQAYLPHMDKKHGTLLSLNVECNK